MIRIIALLVLSFFLSVKMQGQKILHIKLVYVSENCPLPALASCTSSDFSFCSEKGLNFLITYDQMFVRNFSKRYEELHPQDGNGIVPEITPHIMGVIEYSNGICGISIDTVCFGKRHGICKNGVRMEDDKELLVLIKEKIGWK